MKNEFFAIQLHSERSIAIAAASTSLFISLIFHIFEQFRAGWFLSRCIVSLEPAALANARLLHISISKIPNQHQAHINAHSTIMAFFFLNRLANSVRFNSRSNIYLYTWSERKYRERERRKRIAHTIKLIVKMPRHVQSINSNWYWSITAIYIEQFLQTNETTIFNGNIGIVER